MSKPPYFYPIYLCIFPLPLKTKLIRPSVNLSRENLYMRRNGLLYGEIDCREFHFKSGGNGCRPSFANKNFIYHTLNFFSLTSSQPLWQTDKSGSAAWRCTSFGFSQNIRCATLFFRLKIRLWHVTEGKFRGKFKDQSVRLLGNLVLIKLVLKPGSTN